MKGDVHSKGMSKYPKGPVRQHHALATGASLAKPNTANKGGGFDKCGKGAAPANMGKGGTISSSGTTGGPRGGSIPASKMTPA